MPAVIRRTLVAFVVAATAVVALAGSADAGTVAPDYDTAVRDIVFPVVGDYTYSDTFGACRSGCSRGHEGTDIMAAKLTKLVAARDATVSWLKDTATPDGSNGNYLILRDAQGWEYWYIHINNDSPGTDDGANPKQWIFAPGIARGSTVEAGQHVAYVGDSGNAEWTAPHLHFEIHKPDGTIINPYKSLRSATVLAEPRMSDEQQQRAGAYVSALAQDFLARDATSQEVQAGIDHLSAGKSRKSLVSSNYAYSDEWITVLVTGLYRSTLGREPDGPGLRNWIEAIKRGMSPADVGAGFYASDEYFRRAGNANRAWVADLYREILGRNPDRPGLDSWTAQADRGVSRRTIAAGFYGSIESRQTRVAQLYRQLLGRNPDPTGMSTWSRVLSNGRDIDLAATLATSSEYYGRAARRAGL